MHVDDCLERQILLNRKGLSYNRTVPRNRRACRVLEQPQRLRAGMKWTGTDLPDEKVQGGKE